MKHNNKGKSKIIITGTKGANAGNQVQASSRDFRHRGSTLRKGPTCGPDAGNDFLQVQIVFGPRRSHRSGSGILFISDVLFLGKHVFKKNITG
jgi:hypothetical protein